MNLGLAGRVAAVAGASSGLGLAIATALAAEGADVAIGARGVERLTRARRQVDAAGPGRVLATPLDVREHGAVRRWMDDVAGDLGAVHVVAANGGGPPPGAATEFGLDAYRDAVELNLLSQISIVQAALPHLRTAAWGRVLFVTSMSVKQPIPTLALSNTARAGIAGYAKSLVADLGGAGITVNLLAPGYHLTQRVEDLLGDDRQVALGALTDDIPIGRLGDPADLGAVAAFLCSEQASFITGAVIPVDGGQTRGLL